jgi:hypothetical protein
MELSGSTVVVQSQTAGDSFTFNDTQYTANQDGLVEVPVECVSEILPFAFVPTDKTITTKSKSK